MAAAVGEYMYVYGAGGPTTNQPLADIWRYHVPTKEWSRYPAVAVGETGGNAYPTVAVYEAAASLIEVEKALSMVAFGGHRADKFLGDTTFLYVGRLEE